MYRPSNLEDPLSKDKYGTVMQVHVKDPGPLHLAGPYLPVTTIVQSRYFK